MERTLTSENESRRRDIGIIKGTALSLVGLVLALTKLFGCPSPFAAALLCACDGLECIFIFVGAAAGYIINGGISTGIAYIMAMGIITLLRIAAGAILQAKIGGLTRIIQSVSAGICISAANIFIAGGVYEIFISLAFGIISASFAYCADKLRRIGIKGIFTEAGTGVTASMCVLTVFVTAAFTSITVGVINLGVFVTALAILYASDIRADASEAVCAVLLTAGVAAGNTDFSTSCIMISVTAPIIMLAGRYGRITRACAFITTIGFGTVVTGMTETGGIAAISSLSAALIYMAIPERFSPFSRVTRYAEIAGNPKPYAAFGKKLGNMSSAVEDMRTSVLKTAKALENENIQDISWVYDKASEKVCRTCPSGMKCWGQNYNDTADAMNKAVLILKSGSFINEDMLGAKLGSECIKSRELSAELNRQYAVYCSSESASHKVTEMRNVLTSQLSATGALLRKMSEELEKNDTYDDKAASEAEKVFGELGIEKPAVIALVIGSRLSIDAYGCGAVSASPEEIADRLAFTLRREFDIPMITECDGKIHITVSERARFDAQIRVFRKNKSGTSRSGDCADCFNDGKGHVYMILSDGMGSGSRARIDSAFTCGMMSRMLKAGIDLEPALDMLNTSLLVKSSDESFATLDLCRIDLNTGDVLTCKAGGAVTYIRCGNTFTSIKEDGLPLGVGFQTNYKGKRFRLSEGDMIIMTSDGAQSDPDWLRNVVMRDKHADIDRITETIGEALRLSSDSETEDDMTVVSVKLTR